MRHLKSFNLNKGLCESVNKDMDIYKIENLYNYLIEINYPYKEADGFGTKVFDLNYKGLELQLFCYDNMDADEDKLLSNTYTFYIVADKKEYKNFLKNVPDIIEHLKNKK